MNKKHRGLSLIELFVGIAVMMIATSVAVIHISSAVTPKREAERITAYLMNVLNQADRVKADLKLEVYETDDSKTKLVVYYKDSEGTYKIRDSIELHNTLNYEFHLDKNSTTGENEWTYNLDNYPHGVKVFTSDSLKKGETDYSTGVHKYIALTLDKHQDYYIIITDKDIQPEPEKDTKSE